ncbi:DUF2971 domain-containing protein [Legionella maioricensis]|uniref:DUF2971 domain-containing protein n=1 Tax=Legionella maioricensis TaxID=2896528 RepID=A0A9X2ICE2_9GAMM|nr:DUF2971 domain-containing protein [Legionella maioricensis]MCL9685834.1 DUF2971 domain-containing protein [Legionella maioricensis]MCL9689240.1 DUF2971 domain-containing protein [Legionella maioricensis]
MLKNLKGYENVEGSQLAWRYINPQKFESLLKNKSLYFASARQLGEKHEGSITDAEIKAKFDIDFSKVPQNEFNILKKFYKHYKFGGSSTWEPLLDFTKINCWHLNEFESSAMWQLYANNKGIAIQTNVNNLCNSLSEYKIRPEYGSENIYIGTVKYINFSTANRGGIELDFQRFMFKRNVFSSENELRLLIYLGTAVEFGVNIPMDGIFVPVDLEQLISKIYLSPYLNEETKKRIINMQKKYGFQFEIVDSELGNEPVY